MGSFEVEESLSISNASYGFVDHAKRIFQSLLGPVRFLKMWDSLESNISYLARTLCLFFSYSSFLPSQNV